MSREKKHWIVVCISDTHQRHRLLTDRLKSIKDGDILIHCGDMTNYGRGLNPFEDFDQWLNELPFRYKLIITGNHEITLNPSFRNGIFLKNQSMIIDDYLHIYGASWRPVGQSKWLDIPFNTNIVMTHNPPSSPKGFHVDLEIDLHRRLENVKPVLSVFGHIHNDYGFWKESNEILFANAASSSSSSQILNDPLKFQVTMNEQGIFSIEHLI